ncbi:MAG: hypothetical protein AAF658_17330, partial [Myxococcota bacterium]
EDDTLGVFDTVLGYRRRWYGRADRFLRIPADTRGGGLLNLGMRTESPLGPGTLFTEWHYFQIPETDLDGSSGPAGAELDVRYYCELSERIGLELAYLTFARLGDYRDRPGTSISRDVRLKHYVYAQLDVRFF